MRSNRLRRELAHRSSRSPYSFSPFTTVLAYYYIAETNIAYLHRTIKVPGMILILKFVMMFAMFYGAVRTASVAWGLGDIGVGLMAWLNIIGILIIFFMAKPAMKALNDYESQRKAGVDRYTFDAEKAGDQERRFLGGAKESRLKPCAYRCYWHRGTAGAPAVTTSRAEASRPFSARNIRG